MGIYWLASYPKSGNTWFRIFLANLLQNAKTPVNINSIENLNIATNREHFDNLTGIASSNLTEAEIEALRPRAYELLAEESLEIPFRKIHDAYTYTNTGEPVVSRKATAGAIYFIRNPLDVAVSLANHGGIDIDEAIKVMNAKDHVANYFQGDLRHQLIARFLSWSGHVLSWVDAPGLRIHLMRYEDMLSDPVKTFTEAVKFARLPDDPERIARALEFSSFKELQRQEKEKGFVERVNPKTLFFRKGISGDGKKTLSPAQADSIIQNHRQVMIRFGYLN